MIIRIIIKDNCCTPVRAAYLLDMYITNDMVGVWMTDGLYISKSDRKDLKSLTYTIWKV